MKNFVRLALAAIFLTAFALPAFSWTGPQVSLDNKNGRKVIKICDQGGTCTQSTPFFLGINAQTNAIANHDWTTFMYEAQLHLNYVSASSNGVVPILQVHLLNTSDTFLNELASKLNQLSPRPYLFVRFFLQTAPQPGMEPMKIANLQGQVYNDTGGKGSPWALNEAWLAYQESEITRVLNRLDAQYSGRVMGLHIAYENGGEWFFRPYGYNPTTATMLDWGEDALCGTRDGVTRCNLFTSTNDSGTQPGPIGRHYFYLNDYSTNTETGFCNWSLLPSVLRTSCRAANVAERNNAIPGQPLPGLGQARGVFLNPADTGSLRAAYYNRYVSAQNVNAITRLLAKGKQVSGNRILTATFYGYLYELESALPISGQTAESSLLGSNAIDILAGAYSYSNSRSLGTPISPTGPSDAPRLGNKLWVDEDDTRTHFASADAGFKTVTTLWDSIRILRRNVLTAGLHNRGSYFLDLWGAGWFGRPDMPSDSDSLWANVYNAFVGVNNIQLSAKNRYEAQVAVFTDDFSSNYIAGLTPAGEQTYSFSFDIASGLIDTISRLGTPVKQYLLSDLLKSNLDLSGIKFAVLANAYNVPPDVRQTIDTKLKTPGRTVLFIYAAGYMNQDAAASASNISSLTGINVVEGTGSFALSESFNVNGQTVLGGPDYPLTPWFSVSDLGATTLGTYRFAGGVSLARKVIPVTGGSYTSVFAASPKLPLDVLRKLSEDAGVHHFATKGDIVEAAGNMMILHAATSGYKTISFPQTMPRILETAIWPSDTPMCNNCSVLTQLPFNSGDTRAFRWTSPPIGNFELISGASTLEGWAADLDMPATSISVHVYSGGPVNVGAFVGAYTAANPRPDLTIAFGIPGNNGFRFSIANCPSGTPIYVYAIDPELQNGDGDSYIGSHSCP